MTFQVLSLSGGGFLGLYGLTVLAEFEKETGRPIARSFDLIAGTSVGGIIALGLAAEVPAADLKALFESHGTRIFSTRHAPRGLLEKIVDVLRGLFSPKYKAEGLRSALEAMLGDRCLRDLKHRVIVPAINLSKGRPQIFKTPHHPTFRLDLALRAVDVAMATAAAPTYFPLAQIGDQLFADGGLYANSPDELALHEAEHFLKIPRADIRMLSIGTTTAEFSFSHRAGLNFGLLKWALGQRLVQVILSSQQRHTDYMLKHKLGDAYIRIDELQSREQQCDLGLDTANDSAQRTIRSIAQGSVQRFISDDRLRSLLAHAAPAVEWPAMSKEA